MKWEKGRRAGRIDDRRGANKPAVDRVMGIARVPLNWIRTIGQPRQGTRPGTVFTMGRNR
jgi:hypothetical protein